ncbi:MAG: AMP-binding protein [Pirellulales bacterium]
MHVWESLEFGAHALALKSVPGKTAEEIAQIGRERLVKLVAHARANSEFWRDKLSGVPEDSFQLSDLPTSNKPELMRSFEQSLTVRDVTQAEVEEFFDDPANLGKYFKDKYVLSHTSGSQGQPMLLVQTRENIELLFALQVSRGNPHALNLSEVVKHLLTPARLAVAILKPGFYPSASAFNFMPEGAKKYLDVLQLCVEDEDLLDKLAEFRPTHLTAYASVLHELARAVEAGKLSVAPDLKCVVNISERLMPQTREHYEKIFGAPVLDDYGMGECLFLTNGCSTSGGMHVNADWALLEVVDENNQPVPNGEKGAKVLVTNLANHVQPIIRYEVGDFVTMATEPCQCGNNLPLVKCVEGRDSDTFTIQLPSGELKPLQPSVFELAMSRLVDVREYQLVQEENTRFRIRMEPLPGQPVNEHRAERVIHDEIKQYGLEGKLSIDLEFVERLAADGDKKFKRVVSKVRHDKPERAADDDREQDLVGAAS